MTNPLTESIAALDDGRAIHILTTITDAQRRQSEFTTEATAELQAALGELAGEGSVAAPRSVDDGDLARAALLALSEDADLRGVVQTLIENPAAERYATPELVLSIGAVLVALQIGFQYRSADGRKKLEKKPLTGQHFVDFAGQLFGWLKGK